MRVVKGDNVIVIAGDDRGKTGKVLRVWRRGKNSGRAIVEGVNFVKQAARRTQKNPQGGIVEKEAPVPLSNLMVLCAKCGKGVRVTTSRLADGRRARACAACGEMFAA